MQNKYELEYSFRCLDWSITNEDILKWVWYGPKSSKHYTIADIYYDTPDRILQKNKYVFRKRIKPTGDIVYTVKGPTMVLDGVPGRLELESDIPSVIHMEIASRLPEVVGKISETVQERHTFRTEMKFDGYTLFIDKTTYETGAEYFNIELENTDKNKLKEMKGVAWDLAGKVSISKTKLSKFQIGEAVKALDIKTRISTHEYIRILEYFEKV